MRNLLFLFLFLFSSCIVSTEEFYKLQRDVSSLHSEIKNYKSQLYSETGEIKNSTERLDELHQKLRKSFADTNTRIDELELKLNKLRGEIDNISSEIKGVNKNINSLSSSQTALSLNISKEISSLKNDLKIIRQDQSSLFSNISTVYQELKGISKRASTPKIINDKEAEKLYNEALELYHKKAFDEAIASFERFLTNYPQASLTPNALYWIGESYYSQKKFKEALFYFHRVVIDYSNSNKVSSALLKEIFCLEELGMDKEALGAKEELLVRFPFSDEAKILKERDKDKKKKR